MEAVNREAVIESSTSRKRYLEIDFLKFAAIIFMVFVHTYEVFTYDAFFESAGYDNPVLYAFNYLIEFLGGAPAAPVFMFCMGLGITFSKKSTPSKLMKRGGILLLVGLLVNFFEQILPLVWEKAGSIELTDCVSGLFANDVYFFFGLTFFLFALAYAVNRPTVICGIACALALIGGFFLPYIDFCSDSEIVNLVLGLFVRTDEYSFFPFTSWIVFPTAGYLFGKVLNETKDKKQLYRRTAVICASVLLLVTVVGLWLGFENSMINALDCEDADYYAPNFFSQTWALAFIGIWMPACNVLVNRIRNGKALELISWGSKNVMPLYVIQWLVIAIVTPVLCLSDNIAFTYVACIAVTVLTFLSTKVYVNLKAAYQNKQKAGIFVSKKA